MLPDTRKLTKDERAWLVMRLVDRNISVPSIAVIMDLKDIHGYSKTRKADAKKEWQVLIKKDKEVRLLLETY